MNIVMRLIVLFVTFHCHIFFILVLLKSHGYFIFFIKFNRLFFTEFILVKGQPLATGFYTTDGNAQNNSKALGIHK